MKRRWRPFSTTLILSRPELDISSNKENVGFEIYISNSRNIEILSLMVRFHPNTD